MIAKVNDTPVTKVTDVKSGVVHYIYWIKCSNCDSIVPVPETYYTWHMRVMSSPPNVRCHDCKGTVDIIDEDIYASGFWETGPIGSKPRRHKKHTSDLPFSYGNVCSHTGFGTTYVYVDPFVEAHNELKKFITGGKQ